MYSQSDFHNPENVVWTVSELNDRVSQTLFTNFPPLWVAGEVRGFTRAASGHWYFTLKDATGELACAMFAGQNRKVGFMPKTGDHLEVHGQVSIYRARGSYQMVVDSVRQAGLGQLYEQFLKLKEKLQAEGLFDSSRKKSLKRIYTKIAVVTSLQAAALRDVLTTLRRRAPYAKVTVFETAVQGEEAPGEIIRALQKAEGSTDVEVILLVRGGGSLQDLWAFNDERVARAVAALTKPVIVGVGHEGDVTIVDWVADLRAATPTAAAEHVTESVEVLRTQLQQEQDNMRFAFNRYWSEASQRVDSLMREIPDPVKNLKRARERLRDTDQLLQSVIKLSWQMRSQKLQHYTDALIHPVARVETEKNNFDRLNRELSLSFSLKWQNCQRECSSLTELITELSPQAILRKGYSYVTDSEGRFIKSNSAVHVGENLTVHWQDGQSRVSVIDKSNDDPDH